MSTYPTTPTDFVTRLIRRNSAAVNVLKYSEPPTHVGSHPRAVLLYNSISNDLLRGAKFLHDDFFITWRIEEALQARLYEVLSNASNYGPSNLDLARRTTSVWAGGSWSSAQAGLSYQILDSAINDGKMYYFYLSSVLDEAELPADLRT